MADIYGTAVNISRFNAYQYGINKTTGQINYDQVEELAKEVRLNLLFGSSAVPFFLILDGSPNS